jgi:hypothetical protein
MDKIHEAKLEVEKEEKLFQGTKNALYSSETSLIHCNDELDQKSRELVSMQMNHQSIDKELYDKIVLFIFGDSLDDRPEIGQLEKETNSRVDAVIRAKKQQLLLRKTISTNLAAYTETKKNLEIAKDALRNCENEAFEEGNEIQLEGYHYLRKRRNFTSPIY